MANDVRILYVEDEADIREVAEFALEDEGFELMLCSSGEEALQKAGEFNPELIMLDVMMPGLDGPNTLASLRVLPGLKHTPVVFLTAKVQPNELERFKSLGAIDVIAKPFDPMSLADQLREIWNRSHEY